MNILAIIIITHCLLNIGYSIGKQRQERKNWSEKDTIIAIISATIIISLALRVLELI